MNIIFNTHLKRRCPSYILSVRKYILSLEYADERIKIRTGISAMHYTVVKLCLIFNFLKEN